MIRKRGLIILISDLLAGTETLRTNLGFLRSRGHEVMVLRVLDPGEIEFPFQQAATYEDLETGRHLYVDPAIARGEYRRRFDQHDQQLRTICSELGVDYVWMRTDQPLELALFELLSSQLRTGRQVMRGRPGIGRGGAR